ncbi:hypothetical protein GCM10023231_32170 [Olivibacter ginsenosidimutans]|uniref:Glycogen biosynthesis protein GlgD n=1 Tax=Olivibacter ginsenosidimutans TaxID=1176537 RepID=A0ABP9BX82_9SPHI
MKKQENSEKYQPTDSEQHPPIDDKVVKRTSDKVYRKEKPVLKSPATKRKFSEQPPTKHNTHN